MVGFLTSCTTFVLFLFALLVLSKFGRACGPSEYKSAAGECCPMCNIGSVLHSECSGDLSTTCKPCGPGTFMNEPNGLHRCFTCSDCVKSQGLYIQSTCTTIQNTICGVIDGHYCIEYSNLQCIHALKHSVCEPGQEIKTPGTKTSDTVCVNCTHGFYSSSGLTCTKWTDCTAWDEIQTEDGSSVKDVTCTPKRRERYCLILAVALTSLFFISLWLVPQGHKLSHPIEETNSANSAHTNTP